MTRQPAPAPPTAAAYSNPALDQMVAASLKANREDWVRLAQEATKIRV